MEHLTVFGIFVNLILGTWVTVFAFQVSKPYSELFLRPIVHYLFFYNLGVLALLVFIYTKTNLPQELLETGSIYIDTGYFLVTLFEFGMIYSLLQVALGFQEKVLPSAVKFVLAGGFVIFILSYGVKFLLTPTNGIIEKIQTIQYFFFDNIIIFELPILIFMLVFCRKINDRPKRKLNNVFAWIFLSRYFTGLVFGGFVLSFQLSRPVRHSITILLIVLFNMLYFLWFKKYFQAYAKNIRESVASGDVLKIVAGKFNISKREFEILELLLKGKSNKEIEETLFISYHTVKNHVYNLYQKLGIKTRYELVHFVNQFGKQ